MHAQRHELHYLEKQKFENVSLDSGPESDKKGSSRLDVGVAPGWNNEDENGNEKHERWESKRGKVADLRSNYGNNNE